MGINNAEWPSPPIGPTSGVPIPLHDFKVLMAKDWTVYIPASMGGNDAEFITEVLLTSGIERTYLGYANGVSRYAYLETEMPPDWDGQSLNFMFNWETAGAALNTCTMQIWGTRVGAGGVSDTQLNQLVSLTDTNRGAGLRNISAFSGDSGIFGAGNHLSLMLTRSTGDTLASSVKILSVIIRYSKALS